MAQRLGINVVLGSGWYRHPFIDTAFFDRGSTDDVAADIVRDLEVGIAGTDVRAGIIGEIGCDRVITSHEERSFRAAARAHLRTGVTITTHAARWPIGLAQLDILEQEGVDPRRVIVGHSDMYQTTEYHAALARRGAWIQFDTIDDQSEYDNAPARRVSAGGRARRLSRPDPALAGRLPALAVPDVRRPRLRRAVPGLPAAAPCRGLQRGADPD